MCCQAHTMPSADFCEVVRGDYSTLSPPRGHPADLPRSAVIPSVHRRRIYKVRLSCGWRTLWSRAHSSQAYHTSYPVRVPRPAPSFHASFRPHLTVTPLRFPCPSAPRIPGQGTFTPKHDSMHGTHAKAQRRRQASAAIVYDRARSLLTRETGGSSRVSVSCMSVCDQKRRPDKARERLARAAPWSPIPCDFSTGGSGGCPPMTPIPKLLALRDRAGAPSLTEELCACPHHTPPHRASVSRTGRAFIPTRPAWSSA